MGLVELQNHGCSIDNLWYETNHHEAVTCDYPATFRASLQHFIQPFTEHTFMNTEVYLTIHISVSVVGNYQHDLNESYSNRCVSNN